MSSRRHASTGLHELNTVNETARFKTVLSAYFRVSHAAGKRRRSRGTRRIWTEVATCPATSLEQLKRLIRDAATPVQAQHIETLYTTMVSQLKRAVTAPIILARVLALCRALFQRSAVFRARLVTQAASFFDQLLLAAGESPRDKVSRALRVRNRDSNDVKSVLMLIESWTQDFGARYPSLVAGYAMLVDRGYEFPNERARQQQERDHEVNARRNLERVTTVKKVQRDGEMKRYVVEMEHVVVEMNRALALLVPTLDTFRVAQDHVKKNAHGDIGGSEKQDEDDASSRKWKDMAGVPLATRGEEEEEDVEWENVPTASECTRDSSRSYSDDEDDVESDDMDMNEIVQAYGLGSSSYHLTVEVSKQVCEESSDNDALFQCLADGALRMRKRFLPLLDDWELHSTTDSSASSHSPAPSQREVLQQIHDLRDRITRVLLQWEDLAHGSKSSKQYASTRSAVVSLPLDAYNPSTKHRRQEK